MDKKIFLTVVVILAVGMIFLAGCSSSGSDYNYRGASSSGSGSAPVGGACGVAMPAKETPSAAQAAGVSSDSL